MEKELICLDFSTKYAFILHLIYKGLADTISNAWYSGKAFNFAEQFSAKILSIFSEFKNEIPELDYNKVSETFYSFDNLIVDSLNSIDMDVENDIDIEEIPKTIRLEFPKHYAVYQYIILSALNELKDDDEFWATFSIEGKDIIGDKQLKTAINYLTTIFKIIISELYFGINDDDKNVMTA